MAVIVDTNVLMVASRGHPQADERCIAACTRRLGEIMKTGGLLVDCCGDIFGQYFRNLGFAGQPGAGHHFAKWVHSNQAIPDKVRAVPITPRADGWRRYEEFPDRDDLSAFDQDDQKFVAVAVASGLNPPIINAVDSDWWNHQSGLAAAGIAVEFLCPQHAPDG